MKRKLMVALLSALTVTSFIARDGSVLFKKESNSNFLSKSKMDMDPEEQPKGVVKLNLIPLFSGVISLQGEYGFHKNMSGALGIHFLLPRTLPGFLLPNNAPQGETFASSSLHGWGITPEFRFYPGKKELHVAPHGFYLGLYLRYAKYSLDANYYYYDNSNKQTAYTFTGYYKGTNVGLMLGYQWIISKHFSIDWWFIGMGRGKATFGFDAASSSANLSAQDQADLKTEVTNNFSDISTIFSGSTPDVIVTSNSVKASVGGLPMLSIRGGLCLGFAF